MPTARSATTRSAVAAALIVVLSGCSVGSDVDDGASSPSASSPAPAGSASPGASAATVEQTCARVLETARTAPQRLREDPLGLLEEFAALADTAPAELAGQIREVRDTVEGFRQGERRLTEVVGEVRELQQRCSA